MTLIVASVLILFASPSSEAAAPDAAPASGDRVQRLPVRQFVRYAVMLPRYARENPRVREFVKEAGETALDLALDAWQNSRGETCRDPVPNRFCRLEPPRLISGVSVTWNGRVPGVWTSPRSPRRLLGSLRPGYLHWLSCFAYGDRGNDGRIATSLWYRLSSGGFVNDAWLETGTNLPVAGVPRC